MKVFFIQCNLKGSRRKQKLSATMSGNFLYVKCNLLSVRGARNYLGTGPKVVSQRPCLRNVDTSKIQNDLPVQDDETHLLSILCVESPPGSIRDKQMEKIKNSTSCEYYKM